MSENVIDRAALARLQDVIGGDPDDLAELLDDFETEAPATLEKMREAARMGDLDALRISAHSLKSNARDFGATTLAKTCEVLETDCRDGQVNDPGGRVSAVSDELDRARHALASIATKDG